MDLDVLLNGQELLQDKWSTSGATFQQNENLRVVGWCGKNPGKAKYYIFYCRVCASVPELYGQGYFRSLKGGLTAGKVPCGCSTHNRWSLDQYRTLCKNKAKELGYTFIEFSQKWEGQNTKIEVLCSKHGVWKSGSIGNLLLRDIGCPMCGLDKISEYRTKSDDEMITSFLASGSFHEDSKFWRSERLTSQGRKSYWVIYCPYCNCEGEATSVDFQNGKRPCACSKQRQQECYISWIIDEYWNVLAIKFGIARVSQRRAKSQNSKSVHKVALYLVYTFPDVTTCKKAERVCKQQLQCGILPREEMLDGWTETTSITNLLKIIEIYGQYGGVLKEESST